MWNENKEVINKIYERAEKYWCNLKNNLSKELLAFKPYGFILGLIIFGLFIASALKIYRIIMFPSAMCLLIFFFVSHFRAINMISKLYPISGKGEILIHSINNKKYVKGKRKVCYKVSKNTREIRVKVSFQGKLTNGFFDFKIFLNDGNFFFYPDRITYFNDFHIAKIQNKYQLILDNIFDTGVIQGKWSHKDLQIIFKFPIRERSSYNNVKISSNVKKIIIGVYEDPVYTLSFKTGIPQRSEEVRLLVTSACIKLEYL